MHYIRLMPLSLEHLLFIAWTRHIHARRDTTRTEKCFRQQQQQQDKLQLNTAQQSAKTTTMTAKKIEKINSTFSEFCSSFFSRLHNFATECQTIVLLSIRYFCFAKYTYTYTCCHCVLCDPLSLHEFSLKPIPWLYACCLKSANLRKNIRKRRRHQNQMESWRERDGVVGIRGGWMSGKVRHPEKIEQLYDSKLIESKWMDFLCVLSVGFFLCFILVWFGSALFSFLLWCIFLFWSQWLCVYVLLCLCIHFALFVHFAFS